MKSQVEAAKEIGLSQSSLAQYQIRGIIKPTHTQEKTGLKTLYDDDAIKKAKIVLRLIKDGLNCKVAAMCVYNNSSMRKFIKHLEAFEIELQG